MENQKNEKATPPVPQPIKGFWIFDFDPKILGFVFDQAALKKTIIAIVLFVFTRFLPLPGLEVPGRITLGILLGCLLLWTIKGMSKIVPCFVMLILGIFEKVLAYKDVSETLGTSPFLMLFSMMVFAAGMTNTKMAERLAYFFLHKLGTSPFAIVASLFLTETIVGIDATTSLF